MKPLEREWKYKRLDQNKFIIYCKRSEKMNNTRSRGRTISSGSREGAGGHSPTGSRGSAGCRTSRGEGVTGRPGSFGGSNSAQPPIRITRQENEDDDETQPQSLDANEDVSITLDRAERSTVSKKISQLDPDSLWFSHNKVTRDVSAAIKKHYHEPFMNWTETPQHQRDRWFKIFRKGYNWRPELNDDVRKAFNSRAGKRLKGFVSQVGKSGKKPRWMSDDVYTQLEDKRADPNFKMRSQRALENKRKGAEDGRIVPGHRNGSISTVELVERMTRERAGVRPTPVDIFERSHAITTPTGETIYVSRKAQSIMEAFRRQMAENEQHGVVKPVADVFYEVVGGRVKGQVYGLGQSVGMYYDKSISLGQSTETSHTQAITELQERLATYESQMESMQTELGESRAFAEEMRRQMEEFFAIVRDKYVSEFTPSHPNHNSDDPSSGGNGTACTV